MINNKENNNKINKQYKSTNISVRSLNDYMLLYKKHKAEIYEKTKDKMKQYYIEHRDVILARAKKWNKDNPKKAVKHSMVWYYNTKLNSKLLSVKTEGKENSPTIDK